MPDLSFRIRQLSGLLWRNSEPVTRTLLFLVVISFLFNFLFFLGSGSLSGFFSFFSADVASRPWAFLTYPLAIISPLDLLLSGYWLWVVGSTLERSWTSKVFARFFLSIVLITALGLWLGSLLLGSLKLVFLGSTDAGLTGLWMPLAALTVAWARLNPEQVVLLGLMLSIQGRYLMWITIGLAYFFFAFGWNAPWLGFFALTGIGYAYQFAGHRSQNSYLRAERLYRQGPPTLPERVADWLSYYWRRLLRGFFKR